MGSDFLFFMYFLISCIPLFPLFLHTISCLSLPIVLIQISLSRKVEGDAQRNLDNRPASIVRKRCQIVKR